MNKPKWPTEPEIIADAEKKIAAMRKAKTDSKVSAFKKLIEPTNADIQEWYEGNWGYVGIPSKHELIGILLPRLKASEEGWYLANGVADLAMQHRDTAEEKLHALRTGLRKFMAGDYPHPRSYRPEQCPHGNFYYEECEQCDEDYLVKILRESNSE